MNGFKMFAETYRKYGQDRRAALYDFLGDCEEEDFYTLFDSSAFNDIAKEYLRRACEELETEGTLTEEQGQAVRRRFARLFDEKRAGEIMQAGESAAEKDAAQWAAEFKAE